MPTAWVNPLAAAVGRAEREVGADPAQPRLEHGDSPAAGLFEQGGGGSGWFRGAAGRLTTQPVDCGTDSEGVEGGRGERHQDRQRVTGIGERRGPDLRLSSRRGQVGGRRSSPHRARISMTRIDVGTVVDLDHQSAQSTFDVGWGHTGNFADRIFDYRRRARASAGTAATDPDPGVLVARSASARLPRRRPDCRWPDGWSPVGGAVDWLTVSSTGAVSVCTASAARRHALHPGLQHLHRSTGDPADQGGYAWNPHYSPFTPSAVSISSARQSGGRGCTTK